MKAFPIRGSTPRVLSSFALVLFCALTRSVSAQGTLNYNDGDLFLGFRATDGTSDYLVNIEQPTQFVNASAGATISVATGNAGADLAIAFGPDWYTRIDPNTGRNAVLWAVIGGRQIAASGDPANVLYSTNPTSNPWTRHSDTAQSFTTSLIAGLGTSFSGNQSTPNNPHGLIQNATGSNSYASYQPDGANSNGVSFQTWNPWNEGRPVDRLFFNRIIPGSGPSTVLGAFTLGGNGELTFSGGANPVGRSLNISTRLKVLAGDSALIGGFIVTGTEPKSVLVRGIGPSLSAVISGALADTTLELFQGATSLASNDNWRDTQESAIQGTGAAPGNDLESAILQTLAPGTYTVVLRGKNNSTGVGVVEAYDLAQTSNSQLGNISTRGFVDTGENVMIGGFIVGPDTGLAPKILIRAIGPSLSAVGINNALMDPTLELHDGSGTLIQSNDDWRDDQEADVLATSIQPTDNREAAIVFSGGPGAYTAIVKGKGNATGVALVEAYNLQ